MLVADEAFATAHPRFVTYVTTLLSHLNDSYLDRLGLIDSNNVARWSATELKSYTASMVDAMMIDTEVPGEPSLNQRFSQREAMDAFVQPNALEQLSCAHLGTAEPHLGSTDSSFNVSGIHCKDALSPIRQALLKTAEFLFDQKIIAHFEAAVESHAENTDGVFLAKGYTLECIGDDTSPCLPVGKYAQYGVFLQGAHRQANSTFALLNMLEELDLQMEVELPGEVGRSQGSSKCLTDWPSIIGEDDSISGSLSDSGGAGSTYSDGIDCWVALRAFDCPTESSPCVGNVRLDVERFRVWSGDFLRVYTDPTGKKCDSSGESNVLLAQWSGIQIESASHAGPQLQPVVAKGCLLIHFQSDGNPERSFRNSDNEGNGFELRYDRNYEGCIGDSDCNGIPCGANTDDAGLCKCGGVAWGVNCSFLEHCFGTQGVELIPGETAEIASTADYQSGLLGNGDGLDTKFYPNNLDCTWELKLKTTDSKNKVRNGEFLAALELYYDLEDTHDFLYLSSGFSPSLTQRILPTRLSLGRLVAQGKSISCHLMPTVEPVCDL